MFVEFGEEELEAAAVTLVAVAQAEGAAQLNEGSRKKIHRFHWGGGTASGALATQGKTVLLLGGAAAMAGHPGSGVELHWF